jgi:hypothetical protein
MWMVDPRMMCRQHLLGEHAELHMIAKNIDMGRSIEGYVLINAMEPKSVRSRHDELAAEMIYRGMRHNSPLVFSTDLYQDIIIDRAASLQMLIQRCPRCAERYEAISGKP